MKIVSLIVFTLFIVSINSQIEVGSPIEVDSKSVIEYLKENGFFIQQSNEKFSGEVSLQSENPFGGNNTRKTDKDNITSLQLQACINGDVFGYFESLYKYDTPLKQKIYKEDNPRGYSNYSVELNEYKVYYLKGYQYTEVTFDEQSNFNLEKKTFSLYERFYNNSKQLELVKKQLGLGNLVFDNGDDSPYLIAQINDVRQAYVSSKEYEFKIKTSVKFENERDALKIENNGNLKMIVFYNQVSKSSSVIKPLKVVFHIDGEIIKSIGVNSKIDELIKGYTSEMAKKKSSKEEEINLENVFGQGIALEGIGDGSSREVKYIPNLNNLTTIPAKVAVKIKIDRNGRVFWSEVQLHNTFTNTANKDIIKLAEKKALEFIYKPTSTSVKFDVKTIKFDFKVN